MITNVTGRWASSLSNIPAKTVCYFSLCVSTGTLILDSIFRQASSCNDVISFGVVSVEEEKCEDLQ